jgi:hypothetical protein
MIYIMWYYKKTIQSNKYTTGNVWDGPTLSTSPFTTIHEPPRVVSI